MIDSKQHPSLLCEVYFTKKFIGFVNTQTDLDHFFETTNSKEALDKRIEIINFLILDKRNEVSFEFDSKESLIHLN